MTIEVYSKDQNVSLNAKNKQITAKIESISNRGKVIVTFNQGMTVPEDFASFD